MYPRENSAAVYNRENREKVRRDEIAHEEEQRRIREKQEQADRESRRNLLLERARKRHGGSAVVNLDLRRLDNARFQDISSTSSLDNTAVDRIEAASIHKGKRIVDLQFHARNPKIDQNGQEFGNHNSYSLQEFTDTKSLSNGEKKQMASDGVQEPAQVSSQQDLKHINFFEEAEARERNPERVHNDRLSSLRRGDKKTHTTDARFDEGFGFAHGLKGPKPWYASHIEKTVIIDDRKSSGCATHLTGNDEPLAQIESSMQLESQSKGGMDEWAKRAQDALRHQHFELNNFKNGTNNKEIFSAQESKGSILESVKVLARDSIDETKLVSDQNRKRPSRPTSYAIENEKDANETHHHPRKKSGNKHRKEIDSRYNEKKNVGADKWQKLREERLKREADEQLRQQKAIREALGKEAAAEGASARRYHSGYGYGH